MNRFGLTFHHLGLAAKDEDKALSFLKGLGYKVGERVFDPEQNVNVAMCAAPEMPDVEVISQGEGETPVDDILQRHDDLIYHVCFVAGDVDDALASMEAEGFRVICVSPPKKAALFNGRKVSFYQVAGFGLIEIIDDSSSVS